MRDPSGRFIKGHSVLPARDFKTGKFISLKSMVVNKDTPMATLEDKVDHILAERGL